MKCFLFVTLFISFITSSAQDSLYVYEERVKTYYSTNGIKIDSLNNQYLYYKIYEWIGTKYKYAGESKKGIDCSGFAAEIYNHVYCKQLTGGSADIFKAAIALSKEDLQEGDLVFFKIKKGRISHVGVYLQNNKFAHASVHNGVIISDLNEAYYKKYFYKGGKTKAID